MSSFVPAIVPLARALGPRVDAPQVLSLADAALTVADRDSVIHIEAVLQFAVNSRASDLHFKVGRGPNSGGWPAQRHPV